MTRIAVVAAFLAFSVLPLRAETPPDVRDAAHQQLMTVARWGMCLLETHPEDKVRGIVTSTVMRLDARFAERHGTAATNIARETYGGDFVQRYYGMAKVEHDRLPEEHTQTCRRYGAAVVMLLR